jgi:hypothetical protein
MSMSYYLTLPYSFDWRTTQWVDIGGTRVESNMHPFLLGNDIVIVEDIKEKFNFHIIPLGRLWGPVTMSQKRTVSISMDETVDIQDIVIAPGNSKKIFIFGMFNFRNI